MRREFEYELASELEAENAERKVFQEDMRRRIPQADVQMPPFRYVCSIEYQDALLGNWWPRYSGTLIGPCTVLTAAHNLTGETSDPLRTSVLVGRLDNFNLGECRARNFITFPGRDIGIIHLRHNLGTTVGHWNVDYAATRHDPLGSSISARRLPSSVLRVYVSGYPGDMPRASSFGCRWTDLPCAATGISDPRRSQRCGSFQYLSYDRAVRRHGNILYYKAGTCEGESGGPVWIQRDRAMGGRVLLGIHFGGDAEHNMAELITPDVLAWIRANRI